MNISEASKVIQLLYKDPGKGKKERRLFQQNIALHETFLESVPTVFIITYIVVIGYGWYNSLELDGVNIQHFDVICIR